MAGLLDLLNSTAQQRSSLMDVLDSGQRVDPAAVQAIDANVTTGEGEFLKGLRRFGYSTLATTEAFVGQMAEPFAPGFAKNRFAGALDTMRSMPNSLRPKVETFDGVRDLGTFKDWAAGGLGEGLPSVALMAGGALAGGGVGALAGRARLGAAVGGIGSMVPMEGGETAMQLQQSPQALANTTPAERAAMTLGRGGVNAALESAVPAALVVPRLLGKAARIGPGLGNALGNVGKIGAAGAIGEYGTEAAQDLTGQYVMNQAVPGTGYDLGQANEAGLKGALVGGVLGGGAGVAQGVYSNLGAGVDKVKDLAPRASVPSVDDIVTKLRGAVDNPEQFGADVTNATLDGIGKMAEGAGVLREYGVKGLEKGEDVVGSLKRQLDNFVINNLSPENREWYADQTANFGSMTSGQYQIFKEALKAKTGKEFRENLGTSANLFGKAAVEGANKTWSWVSSISKGVAGEVSKRANGKAAFTTYTIKDRDELLGLLQVFDKGMYESLLKKADISSRRDTLDMLLFLRDNPQYLQATGTKESKEYALRQQMRDVWLGTTGKSLDDTVARVRDLTNLKYQGRTNEELERMQRRVPGATDKENLLSEENIARGAPMLAEEGSTEYDEDGNAMGEDKPYATPFDLKTFQESLSATNFDKKDPGRGGVEVELSAEGLTPSQLAALVGKKTSVNKGGKWESQIDPFSEQELAKFDEDGTVKMRVNLKSLFSMAKTEENREKFAEFLSQNFDRSVEQRTGDAGFSLIAQLGLDGFEVTTPDGQTVPVKVGVPDLNALQGNLVIQRGKAKGKDYTYADYTGEKRAATSLHMQRVWLKRHLKQVLAAEDSFAALSEVADKGDLTAERIRSEVLKGMGASPKAQKVDLKKFTPALEAYPALVREKIAEMRGNDRARGELSMMADALRMGEITPDDVESLIDYYNGVPGGKGMTGVINSLGISPRKNDLNRAGHVAAIERMLESYRKSLERSEGIQTGNADITDRILEEFEARKIDTVQKQNMRAEGGSSYGGVTTKTAAKPLLETLTESINKAQTLEKLNAIGQRIRTAVTMEPADLAKVREAYAARKAALPKPPAPKTATKSERPKGWSGLSQEQEDRIDWIQSQMSRGATQEQAEKAWAKQNKAAPTEPKRLFSQSTEPSPKSKTGSRKARKEKGPYDKGQTYTFPPSAGNYAGKTTTISASFEKFGTTFIVHKQLAGDQYIVAEAQTGLGISPKAHDTQKAAIAAATSRLEALGEEKLKAAVAKALGKTGKTEQQAPPTPPPPSPPPAPPTPPTDPIQQKFAEKVRKLLGDRVRVVFDAKGLPDGVAGEFTSRENAVTRLRNMRRETINELKALDKTQTAKKAQLRARLKKLQEAEKRVLSDKAVLGLISVATGRADQAGLAEHEALHGAFEIFFTTEERSTLGTAFSRGLVNRKLREYFKDHETILNKIDPKSKDFDAEEAAAYGFQLWMLDPTKLQLGEQVNTLFERFKSFLRKIFGILTAEERAKLILEDLASGRRAERGTSPLAMELDKDRPWTERALKYSRDMGAVLKSGYDMALTSVQERLVDMENPAIEQIAKLGYQRTGEEGGGGMVQRMITETRRVNNRASRILEGLTDDQLKALHDAKILNKRPTDAVLAERFDQLTKFFDDMLAYQKDAGADIGVRQNYYPLLWDSEKVLKNKAAFMEMLKKYEKELETTKATPDEIWKSITIYLQRGEELVNVMGRDGEPIAESGRERSLSFITAEDRRPFMGDSPVEAVARYTKQAVRNAEFVRSYGMNGAKLQQLKGEAKAQYGATTDQMALVDDYIAGLMGNKEIGMSRELKDLYGVVAVYQNVRLLPFSLFASLVDPMGIAVRTNSVGSAWDAFTYSMKNLFRDWKKEYTPDQWETIAQDFGVIERAGTTINTDHLYTGITLRGTTKKVNDAFFKYNLLNGWIRSNHIMAVKAGQLFLYRASTGFFKGEGQNERYLQELGVQKDDVIYNEQLQRILLKKDELVAAGKSEAEAAEIEARLRSAIETMARQSLLNPTAAELPNWASNPYLAPITHLKQFVWAFNATIINRLANEVENQNYKPLLYAASYVPLMIAADFAKDMISGFGEEPPYKKDWDAVDYVQHGISRSGLTGTGQFFIDAKEDIMRGGSGLESLAGPTAGQAKKLAQALAAEEDGPLFRWAVKALPANAVYDQVLLE